MRMPEWHRIFVRMDKTYLEFIGKFARLPKCTSDKIKAEDETSKRKPHCCGFIT